MIYYPIFIEIEYIFHRGNLMDKIYAYFKNISLLAIVDIATCLFLLVLAFMFFYHKRSLRVFLTLIGAIAAKVVIDALGVFLGNNAFAL